MGTFGALHDEAGKILCSLYFPPDSNQKRKTKRSKFRSEGSQNSPMKSYRVTRYDASEVDCRVSEDDRIPYQLPHIPVHSPTGFNCGYLGSGPSDLALAILVDYFGEDPEQILDLAQRKVSGTSKALRYHQRFKSDVVANLFLQDNESYTLTGEQIGHWLSEGIL